MRYMGEDSDSDVDKLSLKTSASGASEVSVSVVHGAFGYEAVWAMRARSWMKLCHCRHNS